MEKRQAEERINKLKELINDYRYHYHVLDESIMSEAAADSLKHELSQLENEFPDLITPDSPTQRVAGKPLDKFEKVRHEKRMISLADVFSEEEIKDWISRNEKLIPNGKIEEFFTDIKMDGLACSLKYKDGVLMQAVTRGDGLVGEDVTLNVKTIENIPLKIDADEVEVRGEIVIFKKDFDILNEAQRKKGEAEFANPRNLAAGSIRQLDPKVAASRPLKFIAYDLVTPDTPTWEEAYKTLRKLGFQTSNEDKVFKNTEMMQLFNYIKELDEYRKGLKFNTDGMVIKINDRAVYDLLGIVGKTPRGAVAFKFPAEESTTKVRDIVISIGRTGAATPVAILDPVQVAGKEVLFSLRPEGTEPFNYEKALNKQYPDLQFERPEGEVVYRVKGESSDFILKRAIEYYASKPALNIEGLGEKNVVALVDSGLVGSIADLYKLKVAEVKELERFGELSADNLVKAINEAKHPTLAKFITALGIRHVGAQTAVSLARRFKSLDALMNATEDELLSINDIGEVVAESILAWFADEDNVKLINELKVLDVWPEDEAVKNLPLEGKSYIVTGTLSEMDREEAEDKLRELGATVTSSVTKNTTALIVGEKPGKSKLEKAQKLNTPIMTEKEFYDIIK